MKSHHSASSRAYPENLIFPVNNWNHMTQSPMNEYSGCLKLAGLFFSKPKCPTQATRSPARCPPGISHHVW